MSENNGVIRIGRKGQKKFAIGDGPVFEVDVVSAFQAWVNIDESFRDRSSDQSITNTDMPAYHQAAVAFVVGLMGVDTANVSIAEALDFLARLRECYDELADFFQPRSRGKRESPDSSGTELRFSVEGS